MELANEITFDGITYCFEDSGRLVEAKAWIAGNSVDTAEFRLAFPDASPVNTDPLGVGSRVDR